MNQYKDPNLRDNGIEGIKCVTIRGDFTEQDFTVISSIFEHNPKDEDDKITVKLNENQVINFIMDKN